MYAALIRASEKWRGLHVTVFEAKQRDVIRKELDDEHGCRHTTTAKPSAEKSPSHFSSKNRT